MNTEALTEAFNRISKRRNQAIAEYDEHLDEVEKKIPEIVYLNGQIANTSRNIIATALKKGIDVSSQVEEIKRANLYAQQRVNDLLKANGYPEDYLSIKYHCTKCNDTGYPDDGANYCECVTKLVNEINAERVNHISNLRVSTFDTFKLDYYRKDVYKQFNKFKVSEYENMVDILHDCKLYAENFNITYPSILMTGATGLGKTHLSLAIAGTVTRLGYNVIYGSAMDIFTAIEKEKFSKDNSHAFDTLDSVLNTDLLILDDLGVEYDNKFYKSVLYNIINTRLIRNLPVIVSTNLDFEGLHEKYEQRITSRLLGYQIMIFFGRDIRQRREYDKKGFEPSTNRTIRPLFSKALNSVATPQPVQEPNPQQKNTINNRPTKTTPQPRKQDPLIDTPFLNNNNNRNVNNSNLNDDDLF